MAKKPASDAILTTVGTPTPRGYSIGRWSGQAHYECQACPFDTLDLDAMLEHQLRRHSPVADLDAPANPPAEAPAEPGDVAQAIYEVKLEEAGNG